MKQTLPLLKRAPLNGELMVRCDNLSFTYPNGKRALNNISCSIHQGDIFAITGDNGAGKTTFINILMGAFSPTKGSLTRTAVSSALIMQEPQKQLFAATVLEELLFTEKSKARQQSEAYAILRRIGLFEVKDQHPYFISRGQKQLLLIAAVFIKRPSFVIIDEPFTGLDDRSITAILDLIIFFYDAYTPTILFTDQHDALLKRIASRRLHLRNDVAS